MGEREREGEREGEGGTHWLPCEAMWRMYVMFLFGLLPQLTFRALGEQEERAR